MTNRSETSLTHHQFHHGQTAEEVPAHIIPALDILLVATNFANQTSGDRWEFAVQSQQLTEIGLQKNDFRWLVRKGLVEHQREITVAGNDGRAFQPIGDLTFSSASCFVLTDTGVSRARRLSAEETNRSAVEHHFSKNGKDRQTKANIPTWDLEVRELRINGVIVKKYKQKAPNQESILAAFEEEGWPARIDDPLSPVNEQEQVPQRRLCDTIKNLNHSQVNHLIRFRGDGTGEGITWELLEED